MTPDAVRIALSQLTPDIRADVEERAAIMEYDGGLSRPDAERCAYLAYVRETQAGQQGLFQVEGAMEP